jgi:hypothetical protein
MDDLLSIARRQIDNYIDMQMDKDLPEAFFKVRHSTNDTSFMASSRYILELDRVCAEFIAQRGAAVWEILHRCVTTGRVEFSPGLADVLKKFSAGYLQGSVGGLTEMANNNRRDKMELRASEAARKRAINQLEAEIDLFCAVLLRAPQVASYQPPHVINITGSTVTTLQTGSHSTATVTNSSISHQHDSVAVAVAGLKAELTAAGIEGHPLFLVQEVEAELAKPVPEKSRLKSIADMMSHFVSGAINNAPKVPDAIDAVKRSIELLQL